MIPSPQLTLTAAAHALRREGSLRVAPLLDAYRALPPIGHPGASDEALDLGFLAGAIALGGAQGVGAAEMIVAPRPARAYPTIVTLDPGVAELRLPAAATILGDALALTLGLECEAAKLRAIWGEEALPDGLAAGLLGSDPAALDESLGASALDALRALAGTTGRRLRVPRPSTLPTAAPGAGQSAASEGGRPLYVFAGATERVLDMLSPFARRLERPLATLAGSAETDDVYEAIATLVTVEPGIEGERFERERDDGIEGAPGELCVDFSRLDEGSVDPRVRGFVRTLQARRAIALLCPRDASALEECLLRHGTDARVVVLLAEGLTHGVDALFPDLVEDAATGTLVEVDNALAPADDAPAVTTLSVASLGFTPPARTSDGELFALLQACFAARRDGALPFHTRVAAAVTMPGDSAAASAVAIRCFERMAAAR